MPGFLKKLINSGLISAAAVCASAAPASAANACGAQDAESAFEEEEEVVEEAFNPLAIR